MARPRPQASSRDVPQAKPDSPAALGFVFVGRLYAFSPLIHAPLMCRLLFLLLATTTLLLAATTPEKTAVLGKVQPEIRLTDGTVFKKAKIVDFSVEKSTATIADPTRIRVVPLDTLPPKLRHQLLTEAGIKSDDTSTPPKRSTTRPTRPAHTIAPAPPPPPELMAD